MGGLEGTIIFHNGECRIAMNYIKYVRNDGSKDLSLKAISSRKLVRT